MWRLLVDLLRPDRVPAAERKVLAELLHEDPPHGIRPLVLRLLRDPHCLAVYKRALDADSRGLIERQVLLDGVKRLLKDDPVDAQIAIAIGSIDAYERFSVLFGAAFDMSLWALRAAGGAASSEKILQTGRVRGFLEQWRGRLAALTPQLRDLLQLVTGSGPL